MLKLYISLVVIILSLNNLFGQSKKQLKIVDGFFNTKNDSLFVLKHSEKKEFNYVIDKWISRTLSEVDSIIFYSEPGSVVGPFETDTFYIWVKIQIVDSSMKMRVGNIWINHYFMSNDSAHQIAKQILSRAQQGEPFDVLCKEFSDDKNKDYECDLRWFWSKSMVPEFSDEIKRHKKGDLFVVETKYGWHVVKMIEDSYLDRITTTSIPLYLKK